MNVRQKKLEMIEAMNRARALEPSSFVPNKLLDTLIEKMNLKNDEAVPCTGSAASHHQQDSSRQTVGRCNDFIAHA